MTGEPIAGNPMADDLAELRRMIADGWTIEWEPSTAFISANHPKGGRQLIARIDSRFDEAIAAAFLAHISRPSITADAWKLSVEQIAQLRDSSLKPEEIAGPPDVQLRRVQELLRWFERYSRGNANPKWAKSHACELAYYIATTDARVAINLDEIEKKAWVKGLNADASERSIASRLGLLKAATHPAPEGAGETHESQTPAVATIRSVQGDAMEAASATGKPPVGAASTIAGDTEPGEPVFAWCRPSVGCQGIYDVETMHEPKGSGWEPLVRLSALTSLRAEREAWRQVAEDAGGIVLAAESSLAAEKQRVVDLERERDGLVDVETTELLQLLEERAVSYEQSGPSAEHTAKLLRDASYAIRRVNPLLGRSQAARAKAEQRIAALEGLLRRYRNETPIGHQPHMIAHKVDALLASEV